jgi:hypothetical protein
MRFSKPLAAAGLLSLSLLTGTALTGSAYADTAHPRSTVAAPHSSTDKTKNQDTSGKTYGNAYKNTDPKQDGKKGSGKHQPTTASLSATVTPGKVRRGEVYTVNIATSGVGNGTTATVVGIDGRTYTVTVNGGTAAKTLRAPSSTKPGSYQVTVTAGSLSDTADVVVNGGNSNKH